VKDGMAAMVDVKFRCSMDKRYTENWHRQVKNRLEMLSTARQRLQKEADRQNNHESSTTTATVSVSIRDDLNMTEVLLDRGYPDDQNPKAWKAYYLPLEGEMHSFNGRRSGISCKARHDPIERRYGKSGWRCSSGILINQHASASIDIYVPHIEAMPDLYRQVKQLIIDSKKPESSPDI